MKLKLISKKQETPEIWSFLFEPEKNLLWKAGQSIRIEIPRKSWGYNERRFTISSLPSDGFLQITTRISDSEFKQDLSHLPFGSELNGYNIEGTINWGDPSKAKLFIAGGTGITLFHIAIRQALIDHLPLNIRLFYSGKESPLLFQSFFDDTARKHDNFIFTHSNQRFTAKYILQNNPNIEDYLIHVAGPQSMVDSIKNDFKKAGLNDSILKSEFLK